MPRRSTRESSIATNVGYETVHLHQPSLVALRDGIGVTRLPKSTGRVDDADPVIAQPRVGDPQQSGPAVDLPAVARVSGARVLVAETEGRQGSLSWRVSPNLGTLAIQSTRSRCLFCISFRWSPRAEVQQSDCRAVNPGRRTFSPLNGRAPQVIPATPQQVTSVGQPRSSSGRSGHTPCPAWAWGGKRLAANHRPLVARASAARADLLILTGSRGVLPRLVSIAHDTSLMRSAQFPLAFPIPPALLALDSLIRNGLATCEGAPSPRRISF